MTARVLGWILGGEPDLGPGELVRYGVAWGAAGGAGEALFRTTRQLVLHQPGAGYYTDLVWMAPLAGAVSALLVGLAIALVCRIADVRPSLFKATLLFGFAAIYGVMRLDGIPLYGWAEVLLSAGLATAAARVVTSRGHVVPRALTRLRPGALAAVVGLTLFAVSLRPSVREWAANLGKSDAPEGAVNVLLIILDTVRGANVGFNGYARETTPSMTEWVSSGTVFTEAVSASPWTLPGHATLFTGRYHYELGTGRSRALDDRHVTLAEIFSGAGYGTAGFVANFEYTTPWSGLAQGFDRYEAIPVDLSLLASSAWLSDILYLPVRALTGEWLIDKPAEEVGSQFVDWLEESDDRPFFAFLNLFDAHDPYVSPEEYATRFGSPPAESWGAVFDGWQSDSTETYGPDRLEPWVNRYDGAIAYIDAQIGLIRSELESRGLLDETLVVITADHGEMWGENGQIGHSQSLYYPVLRVPLAILLPDRVPSDVVDRSVSLVDVPATILDLAGLEQSPSVGGSSLASLWRGGSASDGVSVVLAETDSFDDGPSWAPASRGDMRSLFEGRLHYILNGDGVEELYDFVTDPDEARDLAELPATRESLEHFRAVLDSLSPPEGTP